MNAIELGVFEVSLKRHERQDLSSWRQQHVRLNRPVLAVALFVTPEALRFYEAIIAAALLQRGEGSALPQVGMKTPSHFPAAPQQPSQLLKILPSDQPSSAAQKILPARDKPFSADKIHQPSSLVRKVLPAGAEPFVPDCESGFSPPVLRPDAVHGALPAGCGHLLPKAFSSSHLVEEEPSSSCPLCSHEEPIPSRQQLLRSSRVAAYCNLPQLLVALWLAHHAEAERTSGWEKALLVHCLTAGVHSVVLCALALRWARYLLRRWAKQPLEELVASVKESTLEVEWPKAAGAFQHARVVSCFSEDRRLIEIFRGGSQGVLALRHLEPGDYLVCAQAQRRFGGLSLPLAVGRVRVLGCPTLAEVTLQPQADFQQIPLREASCQAELRVAESGSQTEQLLGSPTTPEEAVRDGVPRVPATTEVEATTNQVVPGPRVSAETQTEDSAPQQVVVPGPRVSAESQTEAAVPQQTVVPGPRISVETQTEVAAPQQVAVPGPRVSTENAVPQQVVVPPPRVSAETQTEAIGGQVAQDPKRSRLSATTGMQTQAEQFSTASQTDPMNPEEEPRACRHRRNGCGWGGRDEEGHASTCPYRRVSCQNKEQRCTWTGSFKDMPSHFCEAITVSCPNATWGCRWRGYQRELQRHAEAKCRVRALCRHHARGCAWRGTDAAERLHGFSCPFSDTELRVLCPNAPRGCPWRGPETLLGTHLDHCKRRPPKQPEEPVSPRPPADDRPCRNQSWGCLWRGAASEELGHAQECCWHSCRWGCHWRGSLSEEPEHAAACSFTAALEPKHPLLAPVNGTPVLDEKVLEKLKQQGACPAGYAWFQILAEDPAHCHPEANCHLCAARFRTGFQCAGGTHFVCHDCLSRPITEGPPQVKDEKVLEVLQQLTGSDASSAWFQTSADAQAAELPAACHLCSARSGAGFHCVTAICSTCVQDALQAK